MKKRQYFIIIFFVIVTVGLSVYSYVGSFDTVDLNTTPAATAVTKDETDESYFKTIDYYLVDKSKPALQLEASELTLSNQNSQIITFNPVGVIYRRDSKGEELEPINFSSKNSRAMTANKELFLEDDVEIKIANSNLKADKVTIFNNGTHLEAQDNVKTQSFDPKTNDQILIDSDFVLYRPKDEFFEYQRHVRGTIKRKRLYEENLSFTTDLLTLSGLKSLMEMKGNVTLKKGDLDASSNQGSVFLENYNKRLKYYSLSDDVRLQETLLINDKKIQRKAFSEKLEGLISEKKIILTGLPKVFQGKDVIKGNRITIRENIETVEVDDANTNITLERE